MMSISTTSTSGWAWSRAMASRPVSAERMTMLRHSSTLDTAKMLRMSSPTIRTFLPSSTLPLWESPSSIWRRPAGGHGGGLDVVHAEELRQAVAPDGVRLHQEQALHRPVDELLDVVDQAFEGVPRLDRLGHEVQGPRFQGAAAGLLRRDDVH